MALDLGELTIALEVENNLGRGLAQAKREVSSLPPHVQQEMSKVVSEMDRSGRAGGAAFGDGFTRDASGRIRNARGQLAGDAEVALAGISPVAARRGEESGGVLAQGMRSGVIRNSPLIVAGVSAALIAGAPAVLTASTALFAGVGIVAAAQSEQVQATWLGAWQTVRDGTIAAARPIEDTLVGMSGRVEARFQKMAPVLGSIFEDAAPQIDVFADGLMGLVDNALPGFQRAIERGMPVTRGFAEFLEKTGTGLTGFLDAMSVHSEAAGQAFSLLGGTMGELLPLLGNLLGTGAELAVDILPLLNSSLATVNEVVQMLGPALPIVAAGFAAMKVAQTAAGWIGAAGMSMELFAARSGTSASATGRVGSALSGIGRVAGPAALGIGLIAAGLMHAEKQADEFAEAMVKGGQAARVAMEQAAANTYMQDGLREMGMGLGVVSGALDMFTTDSKEAEQATRDLYMSMSPLQKAEADVAYWTNELAASIGDSSYQMQDRKGKTVDSATAMDQLAAAEKKAADLAADHEEAIKGVTEALMAQADQSRSMVDANFAYQDSLNGVEDAHANVLAAIHEYGIGSEEAKRAAEALNQAYYDQANAAGELAMSELPAALDEQQRAAMGAKAELDELNRLVAGGVVLPPWMEDHRRNLERIAAGADMSKVAMAGFASAAEQAGYAVTTMPDGKTIEISGIEPETIAPMRDAIRELGFTVITSPDGKTITVVAETEEALANVGEVDEVFTALGLKPPVVLPPPTMDPSGVTIPAAEAGAAVDALGAKSANPMANLSDDPLVMAALEDMGLLDNLNGQTPTPAAYLNDDPLVQQALIDLGILGDLGAQAPTPVVNLDDAPFQYTSAADFMRLAELAAQHAIPLSSLNDGSLIGTYLNDMGLLGGLDGQRPTPVTSLDDGPFTGTANSVSERLRIIAGTRPTPAVSVFDMATGPLGYIKRLLDSIQSKSISVHTTYSQSGGGAPILPGRTGIAAGGNVGKAVRGYAGGGVPSRRLPTGELVGPGGPLDDLIPAITNMGEAIRVANQEWVINGRVSGEQGDARMAALNAGRADIVLKEDRARMRAFAGGGEVWTPSSAPAMAGSAASTGGSVTIQSLTVQVAATMDVHDRSGVKRLANVLADDLERELQERARWRN